MRSIENIAKILIVFLILSWLVEISIGYILPHIDSAYSINHIKDLSSIRFVLKNFLPLAVQMMVAFWLFIITKESGKSPWIWIFFGLTYGLIAAVLYYCVSLKGDLERTKEEGSVVDKPLKKSILR